MRTPKKQSSLTIKILFLACFILFFIETKLYCNDYRTIKKIDIVTSKKLVIREKTINLNCLDDIDNESLKVLINAKNSLSLNSLRRLTLDQAKILGEANCFIELNGLKKISTECLQLISACKHGASLDGILLLDAEDAKIVSQMKSISLNGLKTISIDTAKELVQMKHGFLKLNGLEIIDDTSLGYLASSNITIFLGGLKSLSENQAKIISRGFAVFHLGGIQRLFDIQFSILNKSKSICFFSGIQNLTEFQSKDYRYGSGKLRFDNLTTIDSEFVESLNLMGTKYFNFNEVKELNDRAAKNLGGPRWTEINLPSLSSINKFQAFWLGMGGGILKLPSVNKVDTNSLFFLSRFNGTLDLSGIKEISDAEAEILGNHIGPLDISGLKKISLNSLNHLRKHTGPILLNGLNELPKFGIYFLSYIKNIEAKELIFNINLHSQIKLFTLGLINRDDFFNYILSHKKSTIELLGIKKINLEDSFVFLSAPEYKFTIKPKTFDFASMAILCACMHLIELDEADITSLHQLIPLIWHTGPLAIKTPTQPDNITFYLLSKNKGDIFLTNCESITEKGACFLSRHKGGLYIDRVYNLNFEQAVVLSRHKGPIFISNLLLKCTTDPNFLSILDNEPFRVN